MTVSFPKRPNKLVEGKLGNYEAAHKSRIRINRLNSVVARSASGGEAKPAVGQGRRQRGGGGTGGGVSPLRPIYVPPRFMFCPYWRPWKCGDWGGHRRLFGEFRMDGQYLVIRHLFELSIRRL